jgi:predicted PurR-regulated permease PerM
MTARWAINTSAALLSIITALLSFVTFVLSSFYSTAQAQWDDARKFHQETEHRLQNLENEAKNQREIVARDISEIKATLGQIIEVKLKRQAPQ